MPFTAPLVLALAATLPLCGQLAMTCHSDGEIRFTRSKSDRVYNSRGIGRPLPGVSSLMWYVYDPLIISISEEYGVDPVLVKATIYCESAFRWTAKSRAGAKGLMQVIDGTASRFGSSGNSFDPINNIRCGVRYLAFLQSYYQGNFIKMMAAYNAGERAVDRHGGIPPIRETRNYVPKVLNTWERILNS